MKKIILATLSAGLFVIGVNAHAAGQGGIAGSAVMRLNVVATKTTPPVTTSTVTHVTSSIAIGKQSAYTGGLGGTGDTTKGITFAAGASGVLETYANGSVKSIAEDATLNKGQANSFEDGSTIQLDAKKGTYKGEVKQ